MAGESCFYANDRSRSNDVDPAALSAGISPLSDKGPIKRWQLLFLILGAITVVRDLLFVRCSSRACFADLTHRSHAILSSRSGELSSTRSSKMDLLLRLSSLPRRECSRSGESQRTELGTTLLLSRFSVALF